MIGDLHPSPLDRFEDVAAVKHRVGSLSVATGCPTRRYVSWRASRGAVRIEEFAPALNAQFRGDEPAGSSCSAVMLRTGMSLSPLPTAR